MKKITLGIILVFATLFISCSSNEENPTTPEVLDPRLPNQELFKPAIQLVPKSLSAKTGKSTAKLTETKKRLVKEYSFDIGIDDSGNEIETNIKDNRYSYDTKGRLHSIDRYTDGEYYKNISKFDFDDNNKVIKTYYADIVAEINNGGYISKITAPNGTVTDIYYDEIGRDIKEVENGTYTQRLNQKQPDGSYLQVVVTNPKTATYLYSYDGDKVYVNIASIQKNYSTHVITDNGDITYTVKDRTVETTYELTVDYTKAGVYSSEPIFRCYIYNWMHIKEWKIKEVSEGVKQYEIRYDYDYTYDDNGYLTASNLTITDIDTNEKSTTKTTYTYE